MRATGASVIGLVALAACSGARDSAPRFVAPPAAPVAQSSGAVFRYHPRAAAPMLASLELEDGRLLFAGKRGERWLFDPRSSTLAAALPAAEELLAIARDAGDGAWFVGRSGASYRSHEPLGPFVDVNVPLSPMARVSAGGGVLLGVGRDQRLARSEDDGRTWSPVGPEATSFVDVAVDAHGHALALATPEALFQSDDNGAHFRPSEAPPSGVLAIAAEPTGDGVRITSVLGTSRWGGSESATGRLPPSLDEVLRRGARIPLGPDAGALAGHAADFGGPGYLEARSLGEGKRAWALVAGPLAGPLTTRPLPEAKGASSVVLGSFERHVFLATFAGTSSQSQRGELFASDDAGASFKRVAPDFWGKPGRVRLAVGAGGVLLVAGACLPSEEAAGCAPAGILYRRPVPAGAQAPVAPVAKVSRKAPAAHPADAEGFELAAAVVPALADGATVELAFDTEGRTAFAVSGSTKASSLTLFISEDGGRHFEGHDLGEATRDQDLESGVPLTPGRDGTVSLVLGARRSAPSLLVVDAQGRVLHAGSAPEHALVGAAGLSALAVAADSGSVFESLDGGASWEPRGKLPFALCPGDGGCDVPLRCSSDGCVVGDELTRVGFGAGDEPVVDAYAPVDAGNDNGIERRLRTPIACTLAPGTWRALPGVRELPDADQAAMGDVAWFAVAEDTKSGRVHAYHGRGGPRPRVDTVELLPALAKPGDFAQGVLSQIEGAAAVRYRIPESRAGGAKLRDVEVAWDNLFENRLGRAKLADGGRYVPGDFERGSGGVESARPDLLSIAERGIYLRVHGRTQTEQPTLFLDGTSVTTLPAIAWPSTLPRAGHAEMAHLGSEHLGLLMLSRGGALARARLGSGAWSFDAAGVGLPDPEAFGVVQVINITYANGQAALHVEELDERGRGAKARLFPLRAAGPLVGAPTDVPTELDLPSQPPACSPAERAATARLVARGYPGARHPVVVSDAVEPPRSLLTGDAVLHGTRTSPCASAFEIHPVPGGTPDPGMTEGGIVLLDDLEHAWLLRKPRDFGAEGPRVEYRSMSCRFDPSLELPQEILDAPEALAPKR